MPASMWKSLTVRFMAPGHSLHEAECIAAVIVIDCLVMFTIMGYRFSDTVRERYPESCRAPDSNRMTAGICGSVPGSVDRGRILLQCQLNPAGPGSRKDWRGIARMQGICPAVIQDAPVVCW
jgi:hypothetical protein